VTAAHVAAFFLHHRNRIATTGHIMPRGFVALAATEVEAVLGHVHVQVAAGVAQRTVQIAMFDGVTTVEVAGTTVLAAALADLARDVTQIRRFHDAARLGRELHILVGGMPSQSRNLTVGASRVVANQAIDIFLRSKVEFFILPAIPHVAGGAERIVGRHSGAEVVDDVLFAQTLARSGVKEFPGPMLALVYLLGRLSVAGETSLGDFRPGCEALLQHLELTVISG